ncbi:hypothetical protein DFH08DRAFT_854203 [Mycena albidolilacea]|uniref:Uncharacterized protein n=1 Tax=Mycena albidolilacea TaxID=1033008 RepID=A0AAD7AB68_9AGAR|nr:hypothetical protein DFH08DRAFT_854203 [Mycena albidolilacea]
MFYVIYVLAILCGTALGLKIHNPAKGSPVLILANKLTDVRWSRTQDSDPTSVSFLMENLVGEEKKLVPGGPYNASQEGKDTTSQMSFPDVGTFRVWAVHPDDPSVVYNMSDPFSVMPNNLPASAQQPSSPPPPSSSPDLPGSAETSPPEIPVSTATPAASNSKSNMTPLIIGAIAGGIVLLLLLVFAFLYIARRRRKARVARHHTFNRGMMVKGGGGAGVRVGVTREVEIADDSEKGMRAPYPFARTA